MNQGELLQLLDQTNPWWKRAGWEAQDPDLRSLSRRYAYEPEPLAGIEPDGLFLLRGPRRVGKSVEIKRAISGLLASGVAPRRILYTSCEYLRAGDMRPLVSI